MSRRAFPAAAQRAYPMRWLYQQTAVRAIFAARTGPRCHSQCRCRRLWAVSSRSTQRPPLETAVQSTQRPKSGVVPRRAVATASRTGTYVRERHWPAKPGPSSDSPTQGYERPNPGSSDPTWKMGGDVSLIDCCLPQGNLRERAIRLFGRQPHIYKYIVGAAAATDT